MPLFSLITLPENFVPSTTAFASQLITDLSAPVLLILGVLLGAIVIEIIIGAIRR